MSDIINKVFMAGLGVLSLTREKIEELIDDLAKRGEVSQEEKSGVLDDLVEAVDKRKVEIQNFVKKEVKKILESLDVPTREEFEELKKKIEEHAKHLKTEKK